MHEDIIGSERLLDNELIAWTLPFVVDVAASPY